MKVIHQYVVRIWKESNCEDKINNDKWKGEKLEVCNAVHKTLLFGREYNRNIVTRMQYKKERNGLDGSPRVDRQPAVT